MQCQHSVPGTCENLTMVVRRVLNCLSAPGNCPRVDTDVVCYLDYALQVCLIVELDCRTFLDNCTYFQSIFSSVAAVDFIY